MKYFSAAQIQESLQNLRRFNPFFSTTFLVLKKEDVPVGTTQRFTLDTETRAFLIRFFRVHPKSNYFFRVMRKNLIRKARDRTTAKVGYRHTLASCDKDV